MRPCPFLLERRAEQVRRRVERPEHLLVAVHATRAERKAGGRYAEAGDDRARIDVTFALLVRGGVFEHRPEAEHGAELLLAERAEERGRCGLVGVREEVGRERGTARP